MANPYFTPEGFIRKRLNEILQEKNELTREVFGDDINLTPQSPDGQLNGGLAESDALLWELMEIALNMFNPDYAWGTFLDKTVELNHIERLKATESTVVLTCTGTNGVIIPKDSEVATETGTSFLTIVEVTISSGTATVEAIATETGAIVAPAGTVTRIITPITGWDTVTNDADADVGREKETDSELRVRRRKSVAKGSSSQVDAIYTELSDLDGVVSVSVIENDTDSTVNTIPPHNIVCLVRGGDDQEIADTIRLNKAAGTPTFGDVTINSTDIQGNLVPIHFARPVVKYIYIVIDASITDETFPATGVEDIQNALEEYGDLNYEVGSDVIATRLYTPINSVPGHTVNSLLLKADSSPSGGDTGDIDMAANELPIILAANVTVNLTA